MGKASSSKKVARAAGTGGGRASGKRRPWNYYGVLVLVVILGIAGTAISRHTRNDKIANAGSVPPTVGGTPWHEALAVDICGKIQPNIHTTKDPDGLTVNDAGVIEIHPFVKTAAGANATLGKLASSIGMKLNAAELQLPGGHLYQNGDDCNGVQAHIYVKQYAFAGSTVGTLATVDPSAVKLADGAMVTIAFVTSSQKSLIPPPPAPVQAALTAAQASTTRPSTSTTTPSTTTPSVTVPTPTTTHTATTTKTGSATSTSPVTTSPPSTSTSAHSS
jgi:hypothetical protein